MHAYRVLRGSTLLLLLASLICSVRCVKYISSQGTQGGDGSTPELAWLPQDWSVACDFMEDPLNPPDTLIVLGYVTVFPSRRCYTRWSIVGNGTSSSTMHFVEGRGLALLGNGDPVLPQNISNLTLSDTLGLNTDNNEYLIEAYSDSFVMSQVRALTSYGGLLWTNSTSFQISSLTIDTVQNSGSSLPSWITLVDDGFLKCQFCEITREDSFAFGRPMFGAYGEGARLILQSNLIFGAAASSSLIEVTDGAQLLVSGCFFSQCDSLPTAHLEGHGSCIHLSNASWYQIDSSFITDTITSGKAAVYAEHSRGRVTNSAFVNVTGQFGSSFHIDGGSIEFHDNEFSVSAERFIDQGPIGFTTPSAVIVVDAVYNFTANSFISLAAWACPALLISPQSHGVVNGNTFREIEAREGAIVCVIPIFHNSTTSNNYSSLPATPTHTFGDFNFFKPASTTPYGPTLVNYTSSLRIAGATALIGVNFWPDYLPIPSLTGENATIRLLPSASILGIHGISLASATLILESNIEIRGASAFLNQRNNSHTNTILGQGRTLSLIGTFTWFQTAAFHSTRLVLSLDNNWFCCNSGLLPVEQGLSFHDGSTLSVSGTLNWFASILPVNFTDTSVLAVEDVGRIKSPYPVKETPQELSTRLPVVYSNRPVLNSGIFDVVDFSIVGDYLQDFSVNAKTVLYPSTWGGRDHLLNVSGQVSFNTGSITLDDQLRTGIYHPPFSLSDPPMRVIQAGSPITLTGLVVNGVWAKYSVVSPSSSDSLLVQASEYAPRITIDDSGGALLLDFINNAFNSSISISENCEGLIPSYSSQLGYPRSCKWQNDTRLIITSPKLPLHGVTLDMRSVSGVLASGGLPISQANHPVTPTAILRPLPRYFPLDDVYCTTLVLDASLSTGTGSFDAGYRFLVDGDPTLQAFFDGRDPKNPIVRLPPSAMISGKTYNFTLLVRNWAQLDSEISDPIIVTIEANASIPAVALQGPSNRVHYIGSNLVVLASLEHISCYDPGKVNFVWSQISGPLLPAGAIQSSSSPSLFIAGSYLTTTGDYRFRLSVVKDGNVNIPLDIEASISLVDSPFSIVRTSQFDFPPTGNVQLSVRIGATLSSLAGITPSFSWKGYTCDVSDATNARPSVSAQDLLVTFNLLPPLLCISPSNTSFPVTLMNSNSETVSLDASSLYPGGYTLLVKVTVGSVSKVALVSFRIGQSSAAPAVSILMDSVSVLRPQQKLSFLAIVDGFTGAQAVSRADLEWQVQSGVLESSSSSTATKGSTLTIPYSDIQFGVPLKLMLTASSLVMPSAVSTFETSFDLAVPPWGGSFNVSSASGISGSSVFNFKATQWSSAVAPLRYQYSILEENGRTSHFLTPVQDIPSMSDVILYNPSFTNDLVTVQLTVFDGIGSTTTATVNITLTTPGDVLSDNDLLNISTFSLPQALNHSDFLRGSRLINTLLSELALRKHLNIPLDPTINAETIIHQALVNSALTLARSLSLTEANSALLLNQVQSILEANITMTGLQKAEIIATLSSVVSSQASSFGDFNSFSSVSSRFLIESMSAILEESPEDYKINEPISVIENHGEHLLTATSPGQKRIEYNTDLLYVMAHKPMVTAAEERIDKGSTTTRFMPSDSSMSPIDGFVGYHYAHYDGNFPGMPKDAPFKVVTHLSFTDSKRRRDASQSMAGGRYTTTYNVTTTVLQTQSNPPSCAVWDGGSWSTSGCSTSTSGDFVSCDCSRSGPLSVVFSNPFAPTPGSKGKGLSAVVIAFIVIGPLIALFLILAVLGVLFVPSIRHFVRPYSKRSEKSSEVSTPVTTGTAGQWAPAQKPSV